MKKLGFSQCGVSLVETVLVVPVLLLFIVLLWQLVLLWQGKQLLTHSALLSARTGAVTQLDSAKMKRSLAYGMIANHMNEASIDLSSIKVMKSVLTDVLLFVDVDILNPTYEAFLDFGIDKNRRKPRKPKQGNTWIPSDNLSYHSSAIGKSSKVNIQDANLLKIRARYCYKLDIPIADTFLLSTLGWLSSDAFSLKCKVAGRFPLSATSTVRMQSDAEYSKAVMKLKDVEGLTN